MNRKKTNKKEKQKGKWFIANLKQWQKMGYMNFNNDIIMSNYKYNNK